MTLQQLRCLHEVINQGLNLSRAARALHTSQPAVTKMIRALESELGLEILVRAGPRIVAISQQGLRVIEQAARVLEDIERMRQAADEAREARAGVLRIGTSHLQARYALVEIIRRFAELYPDVELTLRQGAPAEIAGWTASGDVDLGIATLPEGYPANLLHLDAYPITRCVIAPSGHSILARKRPRLSELAKHRLIMYDDRFKTGRLVGHAFAAANLSPRVAMKATDADVVKAYVAIGLGIAVIQEMAISATDTALGSVNVDHLFPTSTSWIMLRRDQYLRQFLCDFVALVSPAWTRDAIERRQRRALIPGGARI